MRKVIVGMEFLVGTGGTDKPELMHKGMQVFRQIAVEAGIKHVFIESKGTGH